MRIQTIVIGLLAGLLLGACGESAKKDDTKATSETVSQEVPMSPAEKEAYMAALLAESEIIVTSIKYGSTVEVTYDAGRADEYDDQLVSHWATIFGVAAMAAKESVTIHSTAGPEPMVSMTATKANIFKFVNNDIDAEQFLSHMVIKAAD